MDIIVAESIDPDEALTRIKAALPVGMGLSSISAVPLKAPTLQHLLRQAEYRVKVETDVSLEDLVERIQELLRADKIIQIRHRRKKEEEIDLRPWLHELKLDSVVDGEAQLSMRLTAGQFGNLRPEAVLKALGLEENWAEIERTHLIFEHDL